MKARNKNEEENIGSVGNEVIERTNALTLIGDSKEYYEYYLRGRTTKRIDISKVSYFLLMRSLELSLKAVIKINEGSPIEEIRKKYGHNVLKLYNYCVSKKYINSKSKEELMAIDILSEFYEKKDFEYTKVGSKTLPGLFYISNLLERTYKEFDVVSQNIKISKTQRYL